MKIAIIHDWLTTWSGAENVLAQMVKCFPDADIHCLIDFVDRKVKEDNGISEVKVSFLQHMPLVKRFYRHYFPLMPSAVESLDLSDYDLVLSSSHAVAKGVIVSPEAIHISYIHSPPRYVWDMRSQYLKSRKTGFLKGVLINYLLSSFRVWDVSSSLGVNSFITNSSYISSRVRKCYARDSKVIHPPVDTNYFSQGAPVVSKGDYFLAGARFVSYKKIDLIIEAFSFMPSEKIIIFGSGPEGEKYRKNLPGNVTLLGKVSRQKLRQLMQNCRAFVYAAKEDFGIVMAEALASGSPVIAYKEGGASDILPDKISTCGVLFDRQDSDCIRKAVEFFIESEASYSAFDCMDRSNIFSESRFENEYREFVLLELEKNAS